MDGPGKERLFASVASQEVRVLGWPRAHRPVGDVRVLDLESQSQAAVPLQLRALLVTLEVAGVALAGEVVGDDGAVVVSEPHLGRQLGGPDPPVLPLVLAADHDPAQVAALALDLHPLLTCRLGVAWPLVTGGSALMPAGLSWNGAGLSALSIALPAVTRLDAPVATAGQLFPTRSAARKAFQVAKDTLAQLVLSVAVL